MSVTRNTFYSDSDFLFVLKVCFRFSPADVGLLCFLIPLTFQVSWLSSRTFFSIPALSVHFSWSHLPFSLFLSFLSWLSSLGVFENFLLLAEWSSSLMTWYMKSFMSQSWFIFLFSLPSYPWLSLTVDLLGLLLFLAMLCNLSVWDLSSLTREWTLTSVQWKCRVLTIGLPGRSLVWIFAPTVWVSLLSHLLMPKFYRFSRPCSNNDIHWVGHQSSD